MSTAGRCRNGHGIYFYGDYCSGKIWGLLARCSSPRVTKAGSRRLLFETGANITTFGQDPAGEVYFADRGRDNLSARSGSRRQRYSKPVLIVVKGGILSRPIVTRVTGNHLRHLLN